MVEPQRKPKIRYPKAQYEELEWHNKFRNLYVPGKYITVLEYLHQYDGDYISEKIDTSMINLRVVSVTRPEFRSGLFNIGGRIHWEDLDITVALPSGKHIPLYVHNSDRKGPYFELNDIIYQELKRVRFVDVTAELSAISSLFKVLCYDIFSTP